jgi:hypothetical protein
MWAPWFRCRDERFLEDAQADYEYHQAQQRMVTQFLEEPLDRAMVQAYYRPRKLSAM